MDKIDNARMEAADKVYLKAADEIKKLVLEELASLNPFPEMEVGVNINKDRYEKTKKVQGILVREGVGRVGLASSLARVIVLKSDGAYNSRGVCIPGGEHVDKYIFHSKFLVREDSETTPFSDRQYLEKYGEIFGAIEEARR